MEKEPRISLIERAANIVAPRTKSGKSVFKFPTQLEAIADPDIKITPGAQNKYGGTKHKRKRLIAKRSRRANRVR